jgi:hypothetical protein
MGPITRRLLGVTNLSLFKETKPSVPRGKVANTASSQAHSGSHKKTEGIGGVS